MSLDRGTERIVVTAAAASRHRERDNFAVGDGDTQRQRALANMVLLVGVLDEIGVTAENTDLGFPGDLEGRGQRMRATGRDGHVKTQRAGCAHEAPEYPEGLGVPCEPHP